MAETAISDEFVSEASNVLHAWRRIAAFCPVNYNGNLLASDKY